MQDIIGDAGKWPKLIRLFWTEYPKHFHRCIVTAFVYVNGLNWDIFLERAEKKFLCRDRAAFQSFILSV